MKTGFISLIPEENFIVKFLFKKILFIINNIISYKSKNYKL